MNSGVVTLADASSVQIEHISTHGIWLFDGVEELFINFDDYPVLYQATIQQLNDFSVDSMGDFHWLQLDVDIERESLSAPWNYPLSFNP